MDGWITVALPTIHMWPAQLRIDAIADWVMDNKLVEADVAISSRIVRFKNSVDAIFFKMSFEGAS